MTDSKFPLNVYRKIFQIVSDGVYAEKDGFNAHQKYKYATEASILRVIRPKLAEYGLVVTFSEESCEQIMEKVTKATYNIKVVDIETGEFENFKMSGFGQDSGDKGLPKCLTAMQKYFFAKTFGIATGDDPENDTAETSQASVTPKTTPAAQPNTFIGGTKAPTPTKAAVAPTLKPTVSAAPTVAVEAPKVEPVVQAPTVAKAPSSSFRQFKVNQ